MQIYLAIYAYLGLIIHQVDIIKAYIESLLDDNKFLIYIKLLPGIEQMRTRLYYRLLRSLYSLKQLRCFWNQNVIIFYKKIGFHSLNTILSIFIYQTGKKIIIISIYINNFFLLFNSMLSLKNLKENLAIKVTLLISSLLFTVTIVSAIATILVFTLLILLLASILACAVAILLAIFFVV